MAGDGGALADQATWRAFIGASYFNISADRCATCSSIAGISRKSCANYFCVQCKVGGLCKAAIQRGGDHAEHPHIQVWLLVGALAVRDVHLSRFMTKAQVDQIQLYYLNRRYHCKLLKSARNRTRTSSDPPTAESSSSSLRRVCHCCGHRFSTSRVMTPNQSGTPVCSLECLLDYELAQQAPTPRQSRRKQNKASITRSDYADYRPQHL